MNPSLFSADSCRHLRLVVVVVLLLLTVELVAIAPPDATTTRTSKTKTTSPKPTKTTKTRTTKTTKTKPTHTTKSTTVKPLYTWRYVSTSRPACPAYFSDTATYASATFSASGSVATGFSDPYSGLVPPQLLTQDPDGNRLIVRTLDDTQIQIFRPGRYVLLVQSGGIYLFNEQCTMGARVLIDNLFNMTGSASAAKRSVFDVDSASTEGFELLPRAGDTKQIAVPLSFVDQCGYRIEENVTTARSVFGCPCLNYTVAGPATVYYTDYFARGGYDFEPTLPNANVTYCKGKVSDINDYFTSGQSGSVLSSNSLSTTLAKIGPNTTADAEAGPFIQAMGVGVDFSGLRQALVPLVNIAGLLKNSGSLTTVQNLICVPGYHYTVYAQTEHFGEIEVVERSAPFKNLPLSAYTLPTQIHHPCTTTYPVSHAYTDANCQAPTPAPQVVAQGCAAYAPSPSNPCQFNTYDCGLEQAQGEQCICYSDYAGNPMCFQPQFIGDCVRNCTSNADCPCGYTCSNNVNCCGGSRCVVTAPCHRSGYEDYYNEYYANQFSKRDLEDVSTSYRELLQRQMFPRAPKFP